MPKLHHMVDQHRARLRPGQIYGVAFGGGTAARVFKCFAILKTPTPLVCLIEIDPKTRGLTGVEMHLTNGECALYFFYRLDNDLREIASPTGSARVREIKRLFKEIEREAIKLRKRQSQLITEAFDAMYGCGEATEINASVSTWIRDDESHITTRFLVRLVRDAERATLEFDTLDIDGAS